METVDWDELRSQILRPAEEEKPKKTPRVRTKKLSLPEREEALRKLEPVAIEVLEEQLASPDPRVAQSAAKIILDHKWGRPTQKQEISADQRVTKVVYESAAITYDDEELD